MSLNVLGDWFTCLTVLLVWVVRPTKQENGCVVSGTVQSGIRGITSVVAWYFVLREVVELVKVVSELCKVALQDCCKDKNCTADFWLGLSVRWDMVAQSEPRAS